jgi:hypothetical protein
MSYFQEPKDVQHFIGGIFTECVDDVELGPKFAATGVIMKLNFTDPDASIVVDFVEGKVFTESDGAPVPNIEMFMTSDVGHEYWLGKVNVSVALAKGTMRAKGPVPKILKIVPLTKHVFPRYEKMIVEAGRPELLGV